MTVAIKNRRWKRVAAAGIGVSTLAAVMSACSSSGGGGSNPIAASGAAGSCSAAGVSSGSISLGAIASLSGSYANSLGPFADGVKARIDAQNAKGGVNGRTLNLDVADDASDVSGNLAAARSLVEGKKVVGIISGSSFTSGGGDYLKQAGLPVTGYGVTKEYETNPNFIPYTSTLDGANSTTVTTSLWGQYLKSKGATTVYSVGSGTPQGAAGATALTASSKAVGLKNGVLTTNLPQGTTNFTAEAQKAKQAGVDALALPLNPTSSLAVLSAMRQGGVAVKTSLLLAGYDPSVLKSAGNLLDGASFVIFFSPFEEKTAAEQAYEQALSKYTKGAVGQFTMVGYLAADLMITGIEKAGSCPSRDNILKAIDSLRGYSAGGLIAPTDFTAATRGKSPSCAYFVTVKSGAFVPDNNGKPICATNASPIKP